MKLYTPGASVGRSADEVVSVEASAFAPICPLTLRIEARFILSPQLSFVAITAFPCSASCSSIVGSSMTSDDAIPWVASVGPTARMRYFFAAEPDTTKPPIATLSPVPARARAEMFTRRLLAADASTAT